MFKINSTIYNVPVYQNTDTVIPVYENQSEVLNIDTWSNTLINLMSVSVIPRNPTQIFKTKRYSLRILPGTTTLVDVSNLTENGLLKPLDIFSSNQALNFYLIEHTGSVVIQVELMDISDIFSISHLLSLPSVSKITLKEGSKTTSVTREYLESLSNLNNVSIVLDFDVLITDANYQTLGNLIISTISRKIRRFTKPIEGQYIIGYVSYASSIFSKAVNMDLWDVYSQTDRYIYLIGDSDVY